MRNGVSGHKSNWAHERLGKCVEMLSKSTPSLPDMPTIRYARQAFPQKSFRNRQNSFNQVSSCSFSTHTHTHLALSAGHVVAPLILLDAGLAFGALFRIGQDPIRRLALVLALLSPHRQLRARRRLMRLLPAPEAKHRPTLAPNAAAVAERRLDYHVAVLPWAKPERFVDVHKAAQGEMLVPLKLLLGYELLKHSLARDLLALVLRARGVHAGRSFLHLASSWLWTQLYVSCLSCSSEQKRKSRACVSSDFVGGVSCTNNILSKTDALHICTATTVPPPPFSSPVRFWLLHTSSVP